MPEMTKGQTRKSVGRKAPSAASLLTSATIAILLVGVFTAVRLLLNPVLGTHSPLMLYIVPVLIAGFVRGGFCGLLTMGLGGVTGDVLFAAPQGALHLTASSLTGITVFWMVSLLVLGMALELARRANEILDRLKVESDRDPTGR